MNTVQQIAIISAERKNATAESNIDRTTLLKGFLSDCNMAYSEAQGFWEGGSETSLVVIINNNAELEVVKTFAFENFNQEAILYQDANQEAYLVSKNDTLERLGRLEQVTELEAKGLNNYTTMNGQHYATVKR